MWESKNPLKARARKAGTLLTIGTGIFLRACILIGQLLVISMVGAVVLACLFLAVLEPMSMRGRQLWFAAMVFGLPVAYLLLRRPMAAMIERLKAPARKVGHFLWRGVKAVLTAILSVSLLLAVIYRFFQPDWVWLYALNYNIDSRQVTIEKKPHDCEWATSPIGNKNCHYEREITKVLTSVSTDGRKIVSYDNRKTWYYADPSVDVSPSVTVSWRRIDE
jgi:hypothetical protein